MSVNLSASALPTDAGLALREVHVQRWVDGQAENAVDQVAEEWPVELNYNGIPHVVMLATPTDLEDLAFGFTLTEAIVPRREEITSVHVRKGPAGHEIAIRVPPERMGALLNRVRNLTGRTGCGLCGAESVEQAIRTPPPVSAGVSVTPEDFHAALAALSKRQTLNAQTGSVHAAAWVVPGRGIQLLREDVGRHNALDKVIGSLAISGADVTAGYLIITSRASYEMVQKAATCGVTLIVAVSAPTALAIDLAQATGVTLIGFARSGQHVVYTHAQRVMNR